MKKYKIKNIPQANNGLMVEGNQFRPLSQDTILLGGKTHQQGGTDISYFGNQVEAEVGETLSRNQNGDMIVFGNMQIPSTNTKFKNAVKEIGKEEFKAEKQSVKANDLVALNDPYNRYERLGFNTGMVLESAANMRKEEAKNQKEQLGTLQEMMLQTAERLNIDPKDLNKALNGKRVPMNPKVKEIAKDGKKLTKAEQEIQNWLYSSPDVYGNRGFQSEDRLSGYNNFTPMEGGNENVQRSLYNAAVAENIDPSLLLSLGNAESNFRAGVAGPKTKSGTAYGHVQFLPSTAKQYGVTEAQLKSKKQEDIDAVSRAGAQHLKSLLGKYQGDQVLALAAYNGGEGAVNSVRKSLGNPNASGQEVMQYWANQNAQNPSNDPSLWRTQTFNYVNTILGNKGALAPTQFRNSYYDGGEGTPTWERQQSSPPSSLSNVPSFLTPMDNNGPTPTNTVPPPSGDPRLSNLNTFNQSTGLSNYQEREAALDNTTTQRVAPSSQPAPQMRLNPLDFMGEAAAIFDRPDYVQLQQYNPQLLQPYQISLQDQINQNQSSFNALRQQFTNNPQALATLAGQNYAANQQVLGNQFRTNQQIANEIGNQNVQTLNDAQLRNIQLADQQYQRQESANAITQQNRLNALNSVSEKINQNKLVNNQLQQSNQRTSLMENFFNYRPNQDGRLEYMGPDAQFNYYGAPQTPLTPEQLKLQTQQNKTEQSRLKLEQEKYRNINSRFNRR